MDDRLHQALDGGLRPDALPPELARELSETRGLLDGVVRSIPSRPVPELGAAVLRRLDAAAAATGRAPAGRPRRNGAVEWLLAPKRMSVAIRPAYALAATLLLAVLLGGGARLLARGGSAEPAAAEVLVHFRFEAPQARTVSLAGDFSNWAPDHDMTRAADGVWTIVVPLTPGVHEYAFVVDGQRWTPDPTAPSKPDGFGGVNSRVAVLRPEARS